MSNLPARRPDGSLDHTKRLYRDPEAGKIGGVCVGLERWSGAPAVLWRLGFVFTALWWGVGIPLYAILWTVMDRASKAEKAAPQPTDLDPEDREIWEAVKKDMRSLNREND